MRLLLTIILNVVIVVLILVFIYVGFMVFQAYSDDKANISDFVNPAYVLSFINLNRTDEWKVYDSLTYSFEYPASWKPVRKQNAQAGSIELVDLKIPVIFSLPRLGSTTTIGYYRDPISKLRPSSIIEEIELTFAGRQGNRWIYKIDSTNVMYEYAVPLNTELAGTVQATTLVIKVESVRQDKDLEELLDKLAQSVKFKEL